MTKTHKIIYYTLLTMMSIGFIGAAIPKVTADPMAVAGFAQAHLPLWFLYFIGIAELAGAIGLWIPKLFKYAAYGLWIILAGAIITTIVFTPTPGVALVPAVYAIILSIIYWLHGKRGSAGATPVAPMETPTETPTQNPVA
jgi:hypothetical protein